MVVIKKEEINFLGFENLFFILFLMKNFSYPDEVSLTVFIFIIFFFPKMRVNEI